MSLKAENVLLYFWERSASLYVKIRNEKSKLRLLSFNLFYVTGLFLYTLVIFLGGMERDQWYELD